jgi:RhtB (resistance to homoserine/threonine) family protein
MDTFLANWLLLVTVFTVALASPGPDFVMIVRNSVLYSRKAGLLTAIGFALGVVVHVAYSLAGLALIISQSVILFNILKFIGAAYLLYVGYQALKSKGFDAPSIASGESMQMRSSEALRSGFMTNLFNPKATLFFLALFTQILDPQIAFFEKFIYGLTCILMTALWFSLVATILTTPKIRAAFLKMSKWIDRVCGAMFIALGLKLAFTKL